MDDSSNRRKTRSSGRKKASSKVADGPDTSQMPDGAEAKSKPKGASPGRSSPEPDCAICLGRLQNKSFTDRCFHMFCFVCLQEWSKVKAECPLCKQKFTSIIHNVRSNEDYDQYPIPPKIPSWEEQARNFRYHTTLTLERRLQINIPDFRQHPQYQEHDYTIQRPSIHNHMATRSHWRRQRQTSSSDFRRRIYTNNMRLVDVTDPRMRTRDTTPMFYSRNPACTHRLVPWLNRELNALLQSQNDNVQFVLELIMGLIKSMSITSEDFYQGIYPYVGRYTRHFMQEFENFARSPYNIAAYDQHAVYQPQTLAVESDSDTDSILSVDDDDNDDVIVISPSQETGRRRQPSPPRHQRESTSLTYRDLSPLLHRVRSLLEYPTGSHLSVNTPGWDSPTPGPSWAAETDLSDSSAAETTVEEETVLDDGIRTMGDAQTTVKIEEECEIDVENTGSNSSSGDSDSDSSKAGSDIVFVGYDRPWQERSPILLSSSDEANVVSQPTSSSTVDKKSKLRGEKKPQTDRHKKRSSDFSKGHSWRTSKRRRTRSQSKTRSRSRSSSRHGHYWRRRSRSRSRSRYMFNHRRHRSRSRSRGRSGSKRKRTSSPPSFDHSFINNRSRASSSLLSWDQKRHRSKSSSVEITYVKRKKSKHKKKEKKHHKKHKSRKHKKRRRASDSEDSQENTVQSVSRPRSLVTVVNKPKQSELKSEERYDNEIEEKTTKKDISTNGHSSPTLQSRSLIPDLDSPIMSSAQTITSDSKSLDSTTTGSPDSKVSCKGSLDSKISSVESNIIKPYKKHPTGHKKSSQNKTASQCTSSSVDLKHTTSTESCPDSAPTVKSQELSSLVKNGTISGPCTQSSESSDGDINEASNNTGQEKHMEEVHNKDASSCTVQSPCVSSDGLDSKEVDDRFSRNMSAPDDAPENPNDSVNIDVSGDASCISDSNRAYNSSDNTDNGGQCKTDHESAGQQSTSASPVVNTSNSVHSDQTLSSDLTDKNKKHQCALRGTDISSELSDNPDSSFNPTDDGPSSDDTTGKRQRSPCVFDNGGVSAPRLGHQTSTIEILDSDSSLNSDSDIDVEDLLDCEGSADSGRTNHRRRSCVIVESPENVAIRNPSDSATDYPRYSSDHDEISSSSAMSDANIFSNTNTSQSQPSSPCLYSSPNLMYNNPMGTNLALSSFNGLFHSSSASVMRTDSFVSNMAVSISTAGVQSQHMTNHVYRTSPGGQWESHHSAHSISRANMGNVELVQTMSGVAHNNLYGSTRSATSSTMAYIPHTTSGQYLPNAPSVQTYTNTQQSYMSTTGQQYSTTSSPSHVVSNASPQANCSLNRNLLPIEGNSQTSLSPLPSYFTSAGSANLWSQDRHIEVADSSEGDSDVDVLFLSDNEDELREINIMDITDEEESCGEGFHVDLISDDSDVEIEEASGPTDSVYENMIPAVLPHGSVSEAVLEDDAERTRRTTCDLSVFVSDEEDTASHTNEQLQCASSSEEDNYLLYSASSRSSEDRLSGPHISSDKIANGEEKLSSDQNHLGVLKTCDRISEESYNKAPSVDCHSSGSKEESDKPVSSSSNVSGHETGSEEESDKPVSSSSGVGICHISSSNEVSDQPASSSSSVCHRSGSPEELDIQVPSSSSVGCHSSGSEKLDEPASSSSNVICPDTGSLEYSTASEGNNTERNIDTDNSIGNLSCRDEDVINGNCDMLDRDSMFGSSDNKDQNSEAYRSSDNKDRNSEACVSSENQSTSKDIIGHTCDTVSDCVEVSEKPVEDQKSLYDCSSTAEPSEGVSTSGSDTEAME
ncbi:uncharacterized protein LOC110453122 [Mizuhopecten yessoensis]|uniref:E3 ubiquitin-protein ligase Topors n=1 Tax=Mizuhopecten yessoensis TaxID=6573 RepID=A0A210QI75_MIZYE|nr:uncharacterized protein LOC110453122 [Mizuhopecten yessoensis]OWF48386.1 E3 ubiquitin-protein ligase Topor [Mizuhopecten yessoensis]